MDERIEQRAKTPRYSFTAAGQLVGRPGSTVKRWTAGHTRRHQGATVIDPPLIRMDGTPESLPLSFLNLLELQMLVRYRDDAALQSIRKALDYCAVELQVDRPLLTVDFKVHGGELFTRFSEEHDDLLVNATRAGQTTIEDVVSQATANIDYASELAQRWWVVSRDVPIVIDSRLAAGRPVTAETAVRIDAIVSRASEGLGVDEIAYDTGASTAEVEAALQHAAA
ncbi:hypothetical protein AB0L40_05930 [Patulibacter sp. NPDC049589]|uniref:hypothetical protein n=1 Tax=Patulibacter sp. NPDC049589 TaxID=3154731 RepID=UPI00342C6499